MYGNQNMPNPGYGGAYDLNYQRSQPYQNYQGQPIYPNQQQPQQPYYSSHRFSQAGNYPNSRTQSNYANPDN